MIQPMITRKPAKIAPVAAAQAVAHPAPIIHASPVENRMRTLTERESFGVLELDEISKVVSYVVPTVRPA
jgi:hypothetical protein